MLYEEIDDPGSVTPGELRERYLAELAAAVETAGIDEAVAATDLDREVVAAVVEEKEPEIDLSEAAALRALDPDAPDAESILLEVRDHLLMGMSMAVMDVEALAIELDDALLPKELQQKIEGRAPMTLAEYAAVQHAIARGKQS